MGDVLQAQPADELEWGSEPEPVRRTVPGWLWRLVGGFAVVATAAVWVPDMLATSRGPRPEPSPVVTAFPRPPPRPPAPLDWKARGNLSADNAFTAAALARVRQRESAATKVLFAASLPDASRLALVALARSDPVSDQGRGVHVRALHVPPGVAVAHAVPVAAGSWIDDGDLVGWAGRSAGKVYAVVLGQPGPLAVEASALIHYSRSGGASRRWLPLSGQDGVVLADLGASSDQIVAVRKTGGETPTYPLVLEVDHDLRVSAKNTVATFDPLRVRGLHNRNYRGPAPALVVQAIATGHEFRFDPAQADLRILWSGEIEAGRPAALVRARRADGPVFQLLVVASQPGVVVHHGPRHVAWTSADVTPWLFVQGDPDQPVLLLNPSGRGTAMLAEAGAPPRTVAIGRHGIGAFKDTRQGRMFTGLSGARLNVLSPAGEIVVSSSLSDLGIDDVFVLR